MGSQDTAGAPLLNQAVILDAQAGLATTPVRPDSPTPRAPPQRSQTMPEVGHSPGAVLVVDDLALNRVVLGHMVRKAGLEVVEAANGAEALEHICSNPPGRFECILMDLQMPVMDGWEATQQVRLWEAGGGAYQRSQSTLLQPAHSPQHHIYQRSYTSPLLEHPTPCTLGPSSSGTLPAVLAPGAAAAMHREVPDHDAGSCHTAHCSCSPPAPAAASSVVAQLASCITSSPPTASARHLLASRHLLSSSRDASESDFLLPLPTHCPELHDLPPGQPLSHSDLESSSPLPDIYIATDADADDLSVSLPAAPPVRRIPIVACTAELLDRPPTLGPGAGPSVMFGNGSGGLPVSPGATAASHAYSCGADECVKKPLSYPTLVNIFERYIPNWSGPATPVSTSLLGVGGARPNLPTLSLPTSPLHASSVPTPLLQPSSPVVGRTQLSGWDADSQQPSCASHSSWPLAAAAPPPTPYNRSISGEPQSAGTNPPAPGTAPPRPSPLGSAPQTLPVSQVPPSTMQPLMQRASDDSAEDTPSFSLFDYMLHRRLPLAAMGGPSQLAAAACSQPQYLDAGPSSARVGDGGEASLARSPSLVFDDLSRSWCGTPCLDAQEPDIQEHLMELMPYLSLQGDSPRRRACPYASSGSWNGPANGLALAALSGEVSSASVSAGPPTARCSMDSTHHAAASHATCADAGSSPAHDRTADVASAAHGELDCIAEGTSGSHAEGQHALWDNAVEERQVRSLCAWDPEEYMGLSGVEAILEQAHRGMRQPQP